MRLEVASVDFDDGSILVEGKRRKQRKVYSTGFGPMHLGRWLEVRGEAPGPLFNPVLQNGEIPLKRLGGESVTYILRRRQEQAEVDRFSPHDVHRSMVADLLEASVDVLTVQRLARRTRRCFDYSALRPRRRIGEALRSPASGHPCGTT